MTDRRNTGEAMAKLAVCYLIGVFVGAFGIFVITGVFQAIPFAVMVGAVVGLPSLIVALLLFSVFEGNIRRHVNVWCVAVPFVAALIFGILAQVLLIRPQPISEELLIYTASAFVGASAATYTFRSWVLAPNTEAA